MSFMAKGFFLLKYMCYNKNISERPKNVGSFARLVNPLDSLDILRTIAGSMLNNCKIG